MLPGGLPGQVDHRAMLGQRVWSRAVGSARPHLVEAHVAHSPASSPNDHRRHDIKTPGSGTAAGSMLTPRSSRSSMASPRDVDRRPPGAGRPGPSPRPTRRPAPRPAVCRPPATRRHRQPASGGGAGRPAGSPRPVSLRAPLADPHPPDAGVAHGARHPPQPRCGQHNMPAANSVAAVGGSWNSGIPKHTPSLPVIRQPSAGEGEFALPPAAAQDVARTMSIDGGRATRPAQSRPAKTAPSRPSRHPACWRPVARRLR